MAQPTAYSRQANWTDFSTERPSDQPTGSLLDAEFNAIKVTTDNIRTNLAIIQRDDGQLQNQSVGLDQLSPEVEVGFRTVTDWTTATDYVARDGVWKDNVLYRCLEAHTSGVFADDLTAELWVEVLDLATAVDDATTDAETFATAAASSASAASTSASTASTQATNASNSATAAAASALAAAATFDSFDDRYLGTKTSDPTLDNDGNALVTGALYFNSVSGVMKSYDGAAWVNIGPVTVPLQVNATVKTGNFNAVSGYIYLVDTSGGAITATLDASPSTGALVQFIDVAGTFGTNNLTLSRNGNKIEGSAANWTCDVSNVGYGPAAHTGSTYGWKE